MIPDININDEIQLSDLVVGRLYQLTADLFVNTSNKAALLLWPSHGSNVSRIKLLKGSVYMLTFVEIRHYNNEVKAFSNNLKQGFSTLKFLVGMHEMECWLDNKLLKYVMKEYHVSNKKT